MEADISTILNLIEKQQKELEQEKEKNEKLSFLVYCYTNEYFIEKSEVDKNYISKDKIKEKIEYYKSYENLEIYEHYNYGEIVQVLKELL